MAEITKLNGGGVLLETSATDSIVLEEEDLKGLADVYNDIQMENERDSNEIQTRNERDSDDSRTTPERLPNEEATTSEHGFIAQMKRQAQTAAATLSHYYMSVETPAKLLRKHRKLVKLLDDHKFMKENSPYGRRGNPNYYSVPPSIVEAVNDRLGTDYKAGFVAKVWLSMKYQKRFSPIFVKFLCVIWFCSLITMAWWKNKPEQTSDAKQTTTTVFNLQDAVREWEKENNYYFSGWRLKNEIKNCGIQDREKLFEYLKNQSATQGASFVEPQKW